MSKVTKIPVEEQIIYWNDQELPDQAVGQDFGLCADTLLYLATENLRSNIKDSHSERLTRDRSPRSPRLPNIISPRRDLAIRSSFVPEVESVRDSSSLSPSTVNRPRVITLRQPTPRSGESDLTQEKIYEPEHQNMMNEEVNEAEESGNCHEENGDDRKQNSSEQKYENEQGIQESSEQNEYLESDNEGTEAEDCERNQEVVDNGEFVQFNPTIDKAQEDRPDQEKGQVPIDRDYSKYESIPSDLLDSKQEQDIMMINTNQRAQLLFREQFETRLREEKALLLRAWANEKKEILKKANEDREELMLENTRLRKELTSTLHSYSIDEMDNERRELRRRCQMMEKQHRDMHAKLSQTQSHIELLKEEHETQRRKWQVESQNSQEDLKRLSQQIRSEQDRVLDVKQSSHMKDKLRKERVKWEEEKQIILKNWREEVEILTVVMKQEQEFWHREKSDIVKRMESDNQSTLRERETQIGSLSMNLDGAYNEIEQLREGNSKLQTYIHAISKEYESNTLLAQSADSAIRELKKCIQELMKDTQAASLLSEAVLQRAVEGKKAEKLSHENTLLRERLHEEMRKRKQLHNTIEDMKGNIRVIIRLRPLLNGELRGDHNIGRVDIKDDQTVTVFTNTQGVKPYEFFRAIGDSASQEEVFEEIKPLIQSSIDGFNVCIMAYGQTGSGKTYTIHGDEQGVHMGVLPRAAQYLFSLLKKYNYSGQEIPTLKQKMNVFTVKCSMVELYLDMIYDLLDDAPEQASQKKLDMRQNNDGFMYVPGVSVHSVTTPEQLLDILEFGNRRRKVHKTDVNPRSSRSHSIFTMYLSTSFNKGDGIVTTNSKLQFVDLAGSERISKSHSEGDRFKEATHINKSLSALGDVIAALSGKKSSHVPYRNSKLTLLLQDSIGGNSKTVMFANISPSAVSISETISTLNFSSRVKAVQNPSTKNLQVTSISKINLDN